MHLRELTSVLRNDLEGWVKGGSKGRGVKGEGGQMCQGYMYTYS